MIVYTYKEEKVILADEPLAAGGEGEVCKVTSCPSQFNNVCAKLYFKPKQTIEQERKIRFMVENPPNIIVGQGVMLAWPVETIYNNPGGSFLGFLMPTAFPDSKKLVILTALKLKKAHKTEWYKFDKELDKKGALIARMKLIKNISIPIHLLHTTDKYVLKDFKPDNVLVTPKGKVTIVDMDSIQICDNGKLLFPGTAATENYVPPEFYNKGVGRDMAIPLDKSWDNFAVGEVFYQLLFGLSPYAVTPKTAAEDSGTLPYCISHNLFPYGKNVAKIAMVPAPHNNFNVIPQPIKDLFIRAFSDNPSDRPQAMEWGRTINAVLRSIPEYHQPKPTQPHTESQSQTQYPSQPTPDPSPKDTNASSKYCPKCGARNTQHAKFCKTCGHSFDGSKRKEDKMSLSTAIIIFIVSVAIIIILLAIVNS